MIGGRDPVIIFHFAQNVPGVLEKNSKIPVVSQTKNQIELPAVPIYLHRSLTGLYVGAENKEVAIETVVETMTDGSEPKENQKGLTAGVTVNLLANKNSIGISVLMAMVDLAYDKLTSDEYRISYMHGATTIFRGKILDFTSNQTADTELLEISIQLSRGQKDPEKKPGIPQVARDKGAVPL